MKHDVNVNSIYVVVESNDLNTNACRIREHRMYFTASETNISKTLGATVTTVSKRTMRICLLYA